MEVLETVEKREFVDFIIEGIKDKLGKEIISINMTALQNASCSYFIICHGDSTTQVSAIANWVEKVIEDKLNEKVRRKQGLENSQWVLLDYVDVVVHIFQKEYRDFYNLEGLWADGKVIRIKNEYLN